MRHLFVSLFAWLLTAAFALALGPQTKAEIDELITFVQTSGLRFIRNGTEHSAAEGAKLLRVKLANAGDRVKTTDDFITGVASTTYLFRKPYLVKFADGHTQPTGDWLRTHLAEMRKKSKRRWSGDLSSDREGTFQIYDHRRGDLKLREPTVPSSAQRR